MVKETEKFPKLNFPSCKFRVTTDGRGNPANIWDRQRGLWLVLTPEEWVRQHLLRFLTGHMGVAPALITQEYPVPLQGMAQRADIVVYGRDAMPLLLVECKAPGVEIDVAVYAQAVRYNTVVNARYILITNGLKHYVYELGSGGDYTRLKEFPQLDTLG